MLSTLSKLLENEKVLVVDDEPDSLEVARAILEIYSVNVVVAENGRKGYEMALEHHPAFIISDLSMPEMNGWEMLEEIKNDGRVANIPVVALTAHAMRGDRDRALAAGFHNYLTKPLRPETFVGDLVRIIMDTPKISVALQKDEEEKKQ
jgi:CheY-like chemotaxis protein